MRLINNKKGQFQMAGGVIWSLVGFLLAVIVGLIVIGALVGGGFFTSTSAEQFAIGNISSNVTSGINTVAGKLPTLFTVIAIAIILAVIGLLVLITRKFGMGGGNFGQ